VVCLDNLNVHLDLRVQTALEDKGCLIKFLPIYSPDYSLIELTFSVLKAWIQRYYQHLQYVYQGDFGGFLQHAIEQSGCDKHAKEHFRHATDGHKFEGDYEAFMQELEQWSLEEV
jgi:DDE superfamily endonuclease